MGGEFGSQSYFQTADYIVCGLLLLASLAIGVFYGLKGGGQKTSAEYILANRSMTILPVVLSLLASYFSGISLQGMPADVYYHGPMLIWNVIPLTIGGIFSVVFFVPLYYNMGLTSVYEYLDLRFNAVAKLCGVFSFISFMVLYMGVVTYTACVAATAATGISVEVAIVSFCAVCSIYTVIGGIKAVLWTDSLQMVLMMAAILSIVIKGSVDMGFIDMWKTGVEGGRVNLLHFNSDMSDFYNGYAMVFGQIVSGGMLITNQYMVQRMVVCKTEMTAKVAAVFYIVGSFIFKLLLVSTGVALYAHYLGCDPTTLGYTTKNDQIVPYFIVDVFGHMPGIPGLLLSGVFGAALSTLSSVLNAAATVVGHHFVKPYWKEMNDRTYTIILKIIVLVSSAVSLGVAFIVPAVGDAIPVIFTVNGCFNGTLFGMYLLGSLHPWCNSTGAVVGYVIGMVVGVIATVCTIVFPAPSYDLPLSADVCLNNTYINDTVTGDIVTSLMYTAQVTTADTDSFEEAAFVFPLAKSWLALLTMMTTIIVASIVTCFSRNDTSKMDPRLVFWNIKSSFVIPNGDEKNVDYNYNVLPTVDSEDFTNHKVVSPNSDQISQV